MRLDLALRHDPEAGCGYLQIGGDDTLCLENELGPLGDELGRRHRSFICVASETAGAPLGYIERLKIIADQDFTFARHIARCGEASAGITPARLHGHLDASCVEISGAVLRFADSVETWRATGDPAIELAHSMASLMCLSVHRRSTILLTATGSFHGYYVHPLHDSEKLCLVHRTGPWAVAFLRQFSATAPDLEEVQRRHLAAFAEWWFDKPRYTLGHVWSALWTAIDFDFQRGVIDWQRHALRHLSQSAEVT